MKRKQHFYMLTTAFILIATLVACGSTSEQAGDSLEGTSWHLIFYRKTQVIVDTSITANFEAGEIGGSAGCNSYFGAYQTEGQNISFTQIGMTEMFCMDPEGVMEQESFYLESLAQAQRYEITDGRLTIFRSDGETLTFEPAE